MSLENRAVSVSLVVLTTIAVFYVLVIGKAFLVPLAVAVMVWYVINALSRAYANLIPWIPDKNWLTTFASLISIGLFIALAVEIVQSNVADVTTAVPQYKDNFNQLARNLEATAERLNLTPFMPDVTKIIADFDVAPLISNLASTFINMISNISLVLIYVLFLMLEQGTFTSKIAAIFPNPVRRESVMSILSHAQEDIQTYLGIKTMTSAITGIVSYFVLLLVGVDFAGFWAFTIFLLNYIPTIGSIIATLFPAVLALVQF